MRRLLPACAACLLAAAAVAGSPGADAVVGFGGRFRAGSWTPLVVAGARPGDVLHAAAQDADGCYVRSPPVRVDEDDALARFTLRFGRPVGRLRLENTTRGTTTDVDLPQPLPSTTEVLLVVGDLPAVGRAVRLAPRPGMPVPEVVTLPTDAGSPSITAGSAARDFDGVDVVVACGSALATVDPAVLVGIDAWIRDGGHLVLAAGASAKPLAAAGGPPSGWLPGTIDELVPLRRVATIETHARTAGLTDRPAADRLRVPLLADHESLAGTIELFEGDVATDLPLIVRRAHGLGSIAWIGLDLDADPFSGWPGTDVLVARLIGTGSAEDGPPRAASTSAPPDLAGQLRVALETPGPDGGITPAPFALVAALGLLYVGLIFPLDWWLVSRSGRPWLAWLTLPVLVGGFTWATWFLAGGGRAEAGPSLRAAELVDVDGATGTVRGSAWLVTWHRDNAAVDVGIGPEAPGQGGDAAVSWCADSGHGFGAVDSAVPHPTLAAADYAYGDSLADLERVPVAAFSSRLFEARWSRTAVATVASDLVREAEGTIRGSFTLRLPFALRDCRLLHGGWSYDVGDLEPGARHDLASGMAARSLRATLNRRTNLKERQAAPHWDRADTDVDRILEIAGFHAAAGGSGYTGLEAGRLARLDLSPLLALDRAVLVGAAADPPAGWTTAWRVSDSERGPAVAPPCAIRLYRIVIPLAAPAAAPRAAGASAE